ncbi:MAG: LytTR family transcriptional regulator [Bacteroidetes bacterium]|nr:LytTR family transcriptional regulator [Fibrella sp.]
MIKQRDPEVEIAALKHQLDLMQNTVSSLSQAVQVDAVDDSHQHIFVKLRGKRQKIYLEEIIWIESERNYVSIFTKTDQITILMPIGTLEQFMPPELFIRVHKSFIVALQKVDYTQKDQIGLMRNSEVKMIPLSRQFRKHFINVVEQKTPRKIRD